MVRDSQSLTISSGEDLIDGVQSQAICPAKLKEFFLGSLLLAKPDNGCVALQYLPKFNRLLLNSFLLPKIMLVYQEIRRNYHHCILVLVVSLAPIEILQLTVRTLLLDFLLLQRLQRIGEVESFENRPAPILLPHYY
jgi:hypothetical protein